MILRNGKADSNVLDRSVKKRLPRLTPADGRIAMDPITTRMTPEDLGYLGIVEAVNDLAADGYLPGSVETVILLPEGSGEETLRGIEDGIRAGMEETGAAIAGGHTEVTDAVTRPLITVGVSGTDPISQERPARQEIQPGMDIVACGYAGMEGTWLLSKYRGEDLLKRFPLGLVEKGRNMADSLSVLPAASLAAKWSPLMINASEGGVFSALWELADKAGNGFTVELSQIPLLQETIEITDHFGVNPYEMQSAGLLLALAGDSKGLCEALYEKGIRAGIIGRLTQGAARRITNGEEERFLDRPAPDSIRDLL